MNETKETKDFAYGVKVGDLVKAYAPGYHIVERIERRFQDRAESPVFGGKELNSLIHYRTVIDGGFKLKKSLNTKQCDASFCTVVTREAVVDEMGEGLRQLTEGYRRVVDLIEKMK